MASSHRPSIVVRSLGLFQVLVIVANVSAGDWPQILGPQRNGIAASETLLDEWPEGGPSALWTARVGSGFAGVAIDDDTVVLFHRQGDDDTLTAYEAATGKKIWSTGFPTTFEAQIVNDDGPRAVPTIHGGRVYAYASNGGLYCVELKTGELVWKRQTHADFQAPAGYFGAGSSPLVEGKLLIVNVGGDKQKAGIVAFNLNDGKTAWQSVPDQASYSSPVATTVDGTRQVLCLTRLNLVSLDPVSGKEYFRTPFGQRGPTVNAAIPILMKDQVLLTASYGIGAEMLTIRRGGVESVWKDEILSSQYTTPILHDGLIYGVDGRQDGGPVTLKCFDPSTRKLLWQKSNLTYSTLIAADGKLLVMQTNGQLRLVRLSRSEYDELESISVLNGTTRALPALSNGRFYVRNENTLKCVQVGR